MKEIALKELKCSWSKDGAKSFDLFCRSLRWSVTKPWILVKGKNGSGKSTMAAVLSLRKSFDSGEILIDGESYTDLSAERRECARSSFIIPRADELKSFSIKVSSYIKYKCAYYGLKGAAKKEAVERFFDTFDFREVRRTRIGYLSDGELQELALLDVFLVKNAVFILDEPFNSLSENHSQAFSSFLLSERRDSMILMIDHGSRIDEKDFDSVYGVDCGEARPIRINETSRKAQPVQTVNSKTRLPVSLFRLRRALSLSSALFFLTAAVMPLAISTDALPTSPLPLPYIVVKRKDGQNLSPEDRQRFLDFIPFDIRSFVNESRSFTFELNDRRLGFGYGFQNYYNIVPKSRLINADFSLEERKSFLGEKIKQLLVMGYQSVITHNPGTKEDQIVTYFDVNAMTNYVVSFSGGSLSGTANILSYRHDEIGDLGKEYPDDYAVVDREAFEAMSYIYYIGNNVSCLGSDNENFIGVEMSEDEYVYVPPNTSFISKITGERYRWDNIPAGTPPISSNLAVISYGAATKMLKSASFSTLSIYVPDETRGKALIEGLPDHLSAVELYRQQLDDYNDQVSSYRNRFIIVSLTAFVACFLFVFFALALVKPNRYERNLLRVTDFRPYVLSSLLTIYVAALALSLLGLLLPVHRLVTVPTLIVLALEAVLALPLLVLSRRIFRHA